MGSPPGSRQSPILQVKVFAVEDGIQSKAADGVPVFAFIAVRRGAVLLIGTEHAA